MAVPINTRWSPREQIDALRDSGPSILFVDDPFVGVSSELTAACPDVRDVIFMGEGAPAHSQGAIRDVEK